MKMILLMLESIIIAIGISVVPSVVIVIVAEAVISKVYSKYFEIIEHDENSNDYRKRVRVKKEQTKELFGNQGTINRTVANTINKNIKQNEEVKRIKLNQNLEKSNII